MDFVNALAFPKGEILQHLQDFFVNFTNVNDLARAGFLYRGRPFEKLKDEKAQNSTK